MDQEKFEALRQKGIIENMIRDQDYMGARDKLTRLQEQFPKLKNINSMVAVCDILCATSLEFPGCGVDYYWVLQVLPSANEADIKSRYQKLLTLLQPIKNKFPSTDLALKLIEDAFTVLSDSRKRSTFDLRRRICWAGCGSLDLQKLSSDETKIEETVSTANCSVSVSTSETEDGRNCMDYTGEILSGQDLVKKQDKYGNQDSGHLESEGNIDNVGRPADSINSPTAACCINLKSSWSPEDVARKRSPPDFHKFGDNLNVEVFQVGQIWAIHYHANVSHRYAQISSKSNSNLTITWLKPVPLTVDERRWCEAELPVGCGSFDLEQEMSQEDVSGTVVFSQMCSWVHGITDDQFEIYPKKGEVWAIYKDWDLYEWSSDPKAMSHCKFEIVEIVTDFSKYTGVAVECLIKVGGFRNIFSKNTSEERKFIPPKNLYIFSHVVPAFRFVGGEIDGVVEGMFELDSVALPDEDDLLEVKFHNHKAGIPNYSEFLQVTSYPENLLPGKPKRSRDDFSAGQVWAICSGTDFMPRRYTLVNDVVSANQVRVTLLEPSILDQENQMEKESIPIACGIFRVGKTIIDVDMSMFSHSVKCQISNDKLFYRIYPRKGEVWAMYRNWSKKWNRTDYSNYECRFVEILSDYWEEKEMRIARLVEVKGCMTFFRRHQYDGFELKRTVSKLEMLSFSHRIPAFSVPGLGRYGIPEGSWHLEPDALPLKHRN